MSVKWKGAKVLRATRRAQIRGIDVIMARCVNGAITNHPTFQNRRVVLEGSFDIHTHARKTGRGISGEWGSADVVYARFREFNPDPGFLRPQADIHYPDLPTAIRRAFK